MTNHDVEREGAGLTATDLLIDSDDTIQQTSEETSLLSTSKKIHYQSTEVSSVEPSPIENEASGETRSPIGIIALLLIGTSPQVHLTTK